MRRTMHPPRFLETTLQLAVWARLRECVSHRLLSDTSLSTQQHAVRQVVFSLQIAALSRAHPRMQRLPWLNFVERVQAPIRETSRLMDVSETIHLDLLGRDTERGIERVSGALVDTVGRWRP